MKRLLIILLLAFAVNLLPVTAEASGTKAVVPVKMAKKHSRHHRSRHVHYRHWHKHHRHHRTVVIIKH